MKTGLTIQQMAQELLRQSKAKQDYLVNTGSLSLSVTSDAPQLRVTENGLDKITPLDIRQTAHRQLGTYLGIPQKYYELMRTDAPELLAYNANYWFSQKNELRTLRTMDGCARAFLSNRYRRIDNLDIASVTLPVIGELPEARFVSTQITDDFMYIKVVNPRLQADVVPGDVVQAGVIISNSETGLGSVIAAIGYLHAVQRYFTEKSLHRYRFSTIAWRSMNSSLNTFRRQEQRRQSHEFSYQAAHPPPDDAFDALRARLLLHDLFLLADKEQALLIRHRLHGCSLTETARREGMSVKRVRHRLKALYRAYFTQKENKQKEL